jgi:hypothetical protein
MIFYIFYFLYFVVLVEVSMFVKEKNKVKTQPGKKISHFLKHLSIDSRFHRKYSEF